MNTENKNKSNAMCKYVVSIPYQLKRLFLSRNKNNKPRNNFQFDIA